MHELSIALALIDAATEQAERNGGGEFAMVRLRLGPLSGVVREALVSAFDAARETSGLGRCRLEIEDVPVVVRCGPCGAERVLPSVQEMRCPACGSPTPDVVAGGELELVAMELYE